MLSELKKTIFSLILGSITILSAMIYGIYGGIPMLFGTIICYEVFGL